MNLSYEINTVWCGGDGPILHSDEKVWKLDNRSNLRTPCQCYQDIYLNSLRLPQCVPEILIMLHDDVELFDPLWLRKVLDVFIQNPNCAVVGLGGAPGLGQEGLYKRPYRISDMARSNYASNQRDHATHGLHLPPDHCARVVVVDAFFMAVRTEFLRWTGGWPVDRLSHHCLDLWLGCEAARQGKETYAVGIDCMHYGGGSSTKPAYRDAKWLIGGGLVSDHEAPHKWLHDEYKDVLPLRIKG